MKEDNNNDFEFISAYFNLELSEEERLLFREKMKDKSFVKKVAIYKDSLQIVEGVDPNSEENIRKQKWRNLIKSNKKIKIVQLQRIIGLVACLIIAFTLINYFTSNDNQSIQKQKAWDKKVGLDFVFRSNADTTIFSLSKALSEYEIKDYDNVFITLKKYDSTSYLYKDILILRSLAYHGLNDSEKALKSLDTLYSYYPDISKWYKGLIHLDNEDVEKAKQYIVIPSDYKEDIKLKK